MIADLQTAYSLYLIPICSSAHAFVCVCVFCVCVCVLCVLCVCFVCVCVCVCVCEFLTVVCRSLSNKSNIQHGLCTYTHAYNHRTDICICIELARIMYIWCIYSTFGREITKYTVKYGVYIRSWPTLYIRTHSQNRHTRTRGHTLTHRCTHKQIRHAHTHASHIGAVTPNITFKCSYTQHRNKVQLHPTSHLVQLNPTSHLSAVTPNIAFSAIKSNIVFRCSYTQHCI
jgi:hypothetical protein